MCSGHRWATPTQVPRFKQTDPAEKTKRLDQAIQDYQKAIDLKKKAMESGAKPDATIQLAGIYNNMARAQANDGKVDDAIAGYNQAAQTESAQSRAILFQPGSHAHQRQQDQ